MLQYEGIQITWLGHDGFKLKKVVTPQTTVVTITACEKAVKCRVEILTAEP